MLAWATGSQIEAAVPPLAMNVDIRNWKTPMYGPLGLTEFQWKCDSQLAVLSIQVTLTPQCSAAAVMSATTCAWLTDRPLGTTKPGRTTRGCRRTTAAGLAAGSAMLTSIAERTRSIIGWVVTLARRSTSPTDERTSAADVGAPWVGVVMSTAVAGPATIMRQPRTSPRARLGTCKADHSCWSGSGHLTPGRA